MLHGLLTDESGDHLSATGSRPRRLGGCDRMVELSLIFGARVVNEGTEKGTCRPPLGLSPSC